jgi:hypothetical protein
MEKAPESAISNLSPLPTFAKTALDLELAEGTVIADQVGEIDCIFLAIAPNGLLPNSC